jgi:hypothetical protein
MRTFLLSVISLVTLLLVYGHSMPDIGDIKGEILSVLGKTEREAPARIDLRDLSEDYDAEKTLEKLQALKGDTDSVDMDAYLKQARDMAGSSDMSDLDEIRKQTKMNLMMNPYLEKIVFMEDEDVDQYVREFTREIKTMLYALERRDGTVRKYFFIVSGAILLAVLLTCRSRVSGFTSVFARMGFSLGSMIIFLSALTTAVCWFALKYDLFRNANGTFFAGPVALLVLSAASLKIYDFNNPVWNRTIFSVLLLSCSAVVVHVV